MYRRIEKYMTKTRFSLYVVLHCLHILEDLSLRLCQNRLFAFTKDLFQKERFCTFKSKVFPFRVETF